MTVLETVERHGGVVPTALLAERGHPPAEVRRAVLKGQLMHPRRGWVETGLPVVDPVTLALPVALRCLSRNDGIAVLDSILSKRLLRRRTVLEVLAALPGQYAGYLRLVDAGAQSGIETRFVLRLTDAQVMFEWPRVADLLRAIVHRREHRWSAAHRRCGLVEL